jgi:phage tail-like protein
MSGSSWLLGGGYPWLSGDAGSRQPGVGRGGVVADPDAGLTLAALPAGPLGLASPDDSLGQLTLPRGVAVDGETVLVLSADGARVLRYDPVAVTLVPLAEVGAEGLGPRPPDAAFAEPRRFRAASAVAAQGGALWVADPERHRVQVFDLASLALVRVHDGLADPVDLAAAPGGVLLLDRGAGRVYAAAAGRDGLALRVELPAAAAPAERARRARWDRLAADRAGRIYLRWRDGDALGLDVFDPGAGPAPATAPAERITDAGQVRGRFDPPPVTSDGLGGLALAPRLLDPCGLRTPLGDAVPRWQVGDRLYVLDLAARTLRVLLPDGRLRRRLGPYDGQGAPVPAEDPDAWSPVDVAAAGPCALILDARHQAVLAHEPGAEAPVQRFAAPADAPAPWRRIAVDGSGCVLLWDGAATTAARFDLRGHALGAVALRDVRAAFESARTLRQPGGGAPSVRLTRAGALPAPRREPLRWPAPRFVQAGTWFSQWLDSGLHACAWHLVELSFADLPPGARVVIRTRTADEGQTPEEVERSLAAAGASGAWREAPPLVGAPQPGGGGPHPLATDLLVPSGPGRYLQLQIALAGDGATAPRLASARLRFPRESLLQYLPAVYASPPEQAEFLDRFLSIAQTTWSGIERAVATFERYLDPRAVPPEALAYLAGWLDLRLEGTWTADQNRRVLEALPALRARWGTVDGLRRWIRVHLAVLGGMDEAVLEAAGLPGIVETFVERRRLQVGTESARLGAAGPLWSPAVERRFQVGVFDRVGEVELVSTGDPETDLFRRHAHAFRVYVPAGLVRTAAAESLLRRAIDLQRPAHAVYELVLVEPRFRVGVQSTLELDSVVGGAEPQPLPCARADDAPSRPPYQRLGFDAVLGGGGAGAGRRGGALTTDGGLP